MIDHIVIQVSDLAAGKDFYKRALVPLGYELIWDLEEWAGFGVKGKPDFWLRSGSKTETQVHVAFRSSNRATVRSFYEAAIAAGGTDYGSPGIREDYHPNYYGAFVLDPEGHNIEAVCHDPE